MKVYSVYHLYDVDGGVGDAVEQSELVVTFENKTDAQAFVDKYSNPYVYDIPYNSLFCNEFIVKEIEITPHAEFDINKTPEMYDIFLPSPLRGILL